MDSYVLLFAILVLAVLTFLQGIFLFADAVGNASSRARRRLDDLSAGDPTTSLRRKVLGEGAAQWLVTILATAGSAPRDAGTRMLVGETSLIGTIGGGRPRQFGRGGGHLEGGGRERRPRPGGRLLDRGGRRGSRRG